MLEILPFSYEEGFLFCSVVAASSSDKFYEWLFSESINDFLLITLILLIFAYLYLREFWTFYSINTI